MTHYSNTANPVDFPQLSVIDRLWGEALDRAASETYTQMSYSQVLKVKQVFAELIVQECANVGERYADGNYEVYNQILKRFGMEEE